MQFLPKRVVEILKKWAPPRQVTFKCPPPGVTLRFAHEFEKSYETLVPRVSSWSENIRKR